MSKSIKSSKSPKQLKKKSIKSKKKEIKIQQSSNNTFFESMTSGFGLGIGMEGARAAFSSMFGNSEQSANKLHTQPIDIPKLCDTELTLLIE